MFQHGAWGLSALMRKIADGGNPEAFSEISNFISGHVSSPRQTVHELCICMTGHGERSALSTSCNYGCQHVRVGWPSKTFIVQPLYAL